jgi:hypothetical protein
VGEVALQSLTTGAANVAIGYAALQLATTANLNLAIEYAAGCYLTTGAGNVFIGTNTGLRADTGSSNICIGNLADVPADISNYLNIGNVILGDMATPGSITMAADPVAFLGIATKQYVDSVAFTNPKDNKYYARQGGATPGWVPAVDEAPLDGGQYVGESGGWVTSSALTQAQGDARYVNVTGDTMTGALNISAPSGTARSLIGQTDGSNRWEIALGGSVAEAGGNTGSDFIISRYDDSGTLTGNPSHD